MSIQILDVYPGYHMEPPFAMSKLPGKLEREREIGFKKF
jgi:hypothetical protein